MVPSPLPCMRLWRVEVFPHEGTIFLAVSEQHRLVTCIKEGLRGNARLGAPPAYATGCSFLLRTLAKLIYRIVLAKLILL